jgi:ribosome-binding factor A
MPRSKPKHHATTATGPSQRGLRVGEMIRHALSEMLSRGDVRDDVLESHIVSISEVRLSPDLKLAICFVIPLGGKDTEAVVEALNRHKKFIRGAISHTINLKFAPELRFHADNTFAEAERIERLLHSPEVRRDIEKKSAEEE